MQNEDLPVRSDRLNILLALSLLMLVISGVIGKAPSESAHFQIAGNISEQKTVLCSLEDSFSAIAERVEPGVVSITAVQRANTTGELSENRIPDAFLKKFYKRILAVPPGSLNEPEFYRSESNAGPITAAGSGTIVRRESENFYVLTNYHLVEDVYQVSVRLADGTALKGIVIGVDPVTDLGVVRISSSKLSDENIVPLGDSSEVKVGSWVLAVGSPYGFEHTLTVGVVSALHRELEEDETLYPDLIQTDAAINKGNSGGPLLDIEGRVIGINTAIASPTGGFIGLGFAIPINTAKMVLDKLITDGRVIRGWLGIGIQELTPVFQEYYGVKQGVLVASVDKKGPAAKAGIIGEDIIIRVGDVPVGDVYQIQRLIANTEPGATVPIMIVREGVENIVNVKAGLSPITPEGRPSPPPVRHDAGVRVSTLTSNMAEVIGLKGIKGVLIIDVVPGSPAEDAGLEKGDIVVSFNGRIVTSRNEFIDMLQDVRPGGIVVLKTLRKNSPRMIGFRLE